MIKELGDIEAIIYLAEKASKKTITSLASRMGITTEDVTEEAESMREEERKREKVQ
jgi:soluble P-type ATPase